MISQSVLKSNAPPDDRWGFGIIRENISRADRMMRNTGVAICLRMW